jgi:hypothetical protein
MGVTRHVLVRILCCSNPLFSCLSVALCTHRGISKNDLAISAFCQVQLCMRNFRIFLLLLLCVAIPLQGYAGLALQEKPCSMMQAMMAKVASANQVRPCCNDADTLKKTGKMCKTGQQCTSGSHYFTLVKIQPPAYAAAQALRFAPIALSLYSIVPVPVWRPPAYC